MRTLETVENVILPALILAAGVLVVQAHAIPYWQATMGAAVGLVASLGAELVGLYLVYQPGRLARWTGLALVTVMVLVPAWVILGPEYSAWRQASAQLERAGEAKATAPGLLAALGQDIAAAERSLREDEAKSALRAGWLDTLERQREAIGALRAKRLALIEARDAPAPAGYDAWAALPTALPVLALLLAFQFANAGAVLRVSGWRWRAESVVVTTQAVIREPVTPAPVRAVMQPPVTTPEPSVTPRVTGLRAEPVTPPVPDNHPSREPVMDNRLLPAGGSDNQLSELAFKRLQRVVRDGIKAHGLNGLARKVRVNKRYLWLLDNHETHVREGKVTLSDAALLRLAERLLPNGQHEGHA